MDSHRSVICHLKVRPDRQNKTHFFQAVVVPILLYGCTTWTLTKCIEKKLSSNCIKTLQAKFNKSWQQHSTKQQLYCRLLSISKTIQIRRIRHAGLCWRSKDELMSDFLQWTPTHGRAGVGRPARTYLQQICTDTRYSQEDMPEPNENRDK